MLPCLPPPPATAEHGALHGDREGAVAAEAEGADGVGRHVGRNPQAADGQRRTHPRQKRYEHISCVTKFLEPEVYLRSERTQS